MADQIDIIVKEEGAASAATNMRSIASSALQAGQNVTLLQTALSALKMGDGVANAMNKTLKSAQDILKAQSDVTASTGRLQASQLRLEASAARTATAQAKLATETQKTQTAMAATEAAIMKAVAAETRASIEAAKLATENVKTQTATAQLGGASTKAAAEVAKLATQQNLAATAAQRLATEQQRTATAVIQASTATAQASAATSNAATAAQRLTTEQIRTTEASNRVVISQQNIAAAAARAAGAQTNASTAAAKLATEQQRTATQAQNAAAAADRAALAALRLANAQKQASKETSSSATSLMQYAKAAAAAAGVGLGASGILKAADAYTTLQNKLQNVSTSQEQVNELTGRLFDLANETRTGIDATATSFARFDRALKYMGKSQEDTLRMTETINKGLIVSGATATEASSALLQLSQAFNAGKLQGDEFRSISENMPMVLDAVAKALDKPINQVKKMSTEGKITAEVMYKAFKLIEKQVDETFAKTTPTMSQAMVVMQNSFEQFIGQVDKATGITAGISKSIIFLAGHMKELAVAAALAGVALLVAYGPTLVTAVNGVAAAFGRLGLAMLANPIGLAVAAIGAAVVLVTAYGDEITLVAGKGETLKDVFRTAWAYIKDGAAVAAGVVKDLWTTAVDFVTKKTESWGTSTGDIFSTITGYAKSYANTMIGIWLGVFNAAGIVWDKFPELVKYAFTKAVNFISVAMSQILNLWVDGLALIASSLNGLAPDLAASITAGLDNLRITLPTIEMGNKPQMAANELKDVFEKTLGKDYVGDATSAFAKRMQEISLQRRRAEGVRGKTGTTLRPEGANTLSAVDDGKAAEKRAAALAKVNTQLSNELDRMFMLKPARDEQAKYDAIEEKMIGKKITLTADEIKSIKDKIHAISQATQVQAAYDAVYETAVAPLRDYQNTMKAADMLLKQGAISQNDFNKAVTIATESYKNAADPMREYNKNLKQQSDLLNFNPKDREVESKMQALQNDLLSKGVVLTQQQTEAARADIIALQQKNGVASAADAIYNATTGSMQGLLYQQQALNAAVAAGTITQEYYANQTAQTNIAMADLKNVMGNGDMFTVFTAGVGQALQGFTTLAKGASDIIGNVMTTAVDGISNSIASAITKGDDLRASLAAVGQTIVTEMLSALIKLGIQYLLNATLATATQATQTAASVAMAGTVAAAWAPAAAAVSLASFGSNSVPAMAGIAATNTLSSTLAMAGFQEGGYTGNMAANKAAGIVHGQEYVFTADSVKRIGLGNLEALQAGTNNIGMSARMASMGTGMSSNGGAASVIIQIINNAPVDVSTKEVEGDDGQMKLQVVIDQVKTNIAGEMRNRRGDVFNATKDAFNLQTSIGPS